MIQKSTKSIKNLLNGLSNYTFVEKPCKIIKVISQNLVDIEYYDNYKTDVLYNVPVQHIQTRNAYIFLKLQVGDRGTVRFLDNDISYYHNDSEDCGNDKRTHNINDGIFLLGFYPKSEQIAFSNDDLVIKSGDATITIKDGDIKISGGNVYIQNVNFLNHTHMAGNTQTGGVVS